MKLVGKLVSELGLEIGDTAVDGYAFPLIKGEIGQILSFNNDGDLIVSDPTDAGFGSVTGATCEYVSPGISKLNFMGTTTETTFDVVTTCSGDWDITNRENTECIINNVTTDKSGANWVFAGGRMNFINVYDDKDAAVVHTASPRVLTGEGVASWSDSDGNLLFYTDGDELFDASGAVIESSIGGTNSNQSSQAAIIVPDPNSAIRYFIISIDNWGTGNEIYYTHVEAPDGASVILGPLGKKQLLNTPTARASEMITAIPNANNTSYWIVWRGGHASSVADSDKLFSIELTTTGFGTEQSSTVSTPLTSTANSYGVLRFSPDGTKLVQTVGGNNRQLTLWGFNRSSGTLIPGSEIIIETGGPNTDYYGAEFSPDGTKLYVGTINGDNRLFQFDLSSGVQATISGSKKQVGSTVSHTPNVSWVGQLQLAPNNKIYVSYRFEASLAVINDPNELLSADGSNEVNLNAPGDPGSFSVSPRSTQLGLPNILATVNTPQTVNVGGTTITPKSGIDIVLFSKTSILSGETYIHDLITGDTTDYKVLLGVDDCGKVGAVTGVTSGGNNTGGGPPGTPTGYEISFASKQIYNGYGVTSSTDISHNLTGAVLGTVQKIYHNSATAPNFPPEWQIIGDGIYFINELNIIYAEYVDNTRIEYWIVQEG